MNKHVPDIERCKQLKAAEFPQEISQFYYVKEKSNDAGHYEIMICVGIIFKAINKEHPYYGWFAVQSCEYFAAPLPHELLQALGFPCRIAVMVQKKYKAEDLSPFSFAQLCVAICSDATQLADLYIYGSDRNNEAECRNDGING